MFTSVVSTVLVLAVTTLRAGRATAAMTETMSWLQVMRQTYLDLCNANCDADKCKEQESVLLCKGDG